MTVAQTQKEQRERVLIIVDMRHAERVRDAAVEYREKCIKNESVPTEARLAMAVAMALQAIFKRPDGWYDTEFRMALTRLITPRLSRDELNRVMDAVYAVVPAREETGVILQLRQKRRAAKLASES